MRKEIMIHVSNYISKSNGNFLFNSVCISTFLGGHIYASKYIAVNLFLSMAGKHIYTELAWMNQFAASVQCSVAFLQGENVNIA